MAQAPVLPTGFELPLEARLPRIKRVVRGRIDVQSPWEIASFLELKTVWHPMGQ